MTILKLADTYKLPDKDTEELAYKVYPKLGLLATIDIGNPFLPLGVIITDKPDEVKALTNLHLVEVTYQELIDLCK